MRKPNTLKTFGLALLAAGMLTLLAALGALDTLDNTASDALYQSRSASDGEIVLIGIDDRAIEELGPYGQWGRDIIAMTLEALNQSEDCRPAAIGIDVLYTGESLPDLDEWLAEAAGQYGNVVTACAAQFGTAFQEDGEGGYDRDDFSVLAFEEPYAALRDVTVQGHINAMLDTDGILRHHMLKLRLPDGTEYPSMALALAQMYHDHYDLGPVALPPVDARNFWYVPFCGEPGDFDESISVADLLSGEIPADYFAGKIVFIGPYTIGLQDNYITSIDHVRQMYGVEYQANAVQALLWGEDKREAGDGLQLALLFGALLLGLLGFWRRRVTTAAVLWAALCGGWVLLCVKMYQGGWVLHVLWIPVGVTVLFAGSLAVNYIQAAAERRQVTNTFKRYVAPEIVNELLKEGTEALGLGGKLTTHHRGALCGRAGLYHHVRDAVAAPGGGNSQPLPDPDRGLHSEKWRHPGQVRGGRRHGLLGRAPAPGGLRYAGGPGGGGHGERLQGPLRGADGPVRPHGVLWHRRPRGGGGGRQHRLPPADGLHRHRRHGEHLRSAGGQRPRRHHLHLPGGGGRPGGPHPHHVSWGHHQAEGQEGRL